jgi:hypothetical protein
LGSFGVAGLEGEPPALPGFSEAAPPLLGLLAGGVVAPAPLVLGVLVLPLVVPPAAPARPPWLFQYSSHSAREMLPSWFLSTLSNDGGMLPVAPPIRSLPMLPVLELLLLVPEALLGSVWLPAEELAGGLPCGWLAEGEVVVPPVPCASVPRGTAKAAATATASNVLTFIAVSFKWWSIKVSSGGPSVVSSSNVHAPRSSGTMARLEEVLCGG